MTGFLFAGRMWKGFVRRPTGGVIMNKQIIKGDKNRIAYRPEGWTNRYAGDASRGYERYIFEAGADAMLETLLKEAHAYGHTGNHYLRHDDYLCDVLDRDLQLR
jgi:hypothetical protein